MKEELNKLDKAIEEAEKTTEKFIKAHEDFKKLGEIIKNQSDKKIDIMPEINMLLMEATLGNKEKAELMLESLKKKYER